jgi:hypothetical protein
MRDLLKIGFNGEPIKEELYVAHFSRFRHNLVNISILVA